jgi:hypothetical protein
MFGVIHSALQYRGRNVASFLQNPAARDGLEVCDFCNAPELFLDAHKSARIFYLAVTSFLQVGSSFYEISSR